MIVSLGNSGIADFRKGMASMLRDIEPSTYLTLVQSENERYAITRLEDLHEANKKLSVYDDQLGMPVRLRMAQRLRKVFHAIGMTIEEFAEVLGYGNYCQMDRFLRGEEEFDRVLIERLSSTFNVIPSFFLKENYRIFDDKTIGAHISPDIFLDEIKKLNPISILYYMCDSEQGQASLIIRTSEHCATPISATWHISSIVGATGASNQVQFFRFLEAMRFTSKASCIVTSEMFGAIKSGQIYTPSLWNSAKSGMGSWVEDLFDAVQGGERDREIIQTDYKKPIADRILACVSSIKSSLEFEKKKLIK